ncbi:MAG: ABC transporter permease [Micrococcales bacterium 73-13]|nr:MAG: ABC transporter permease [Micrococcales bacterium 73-13]
MAFAAFGGGGAGAAVAEPVALKRSWVAIGLLAPGLAYLALFFLAPLVSLVLTSLQIAPEGAGKGEYVQAFNWGNYAEAIASYWPHILRSFGYALIATLAALVIGYPIAYFIGVTARRWPMIQALALTLVIAPFFISFLLRTLAWKQLLGENSWIAQTLHGLGWLPSDQTIVGTPFSVIFGLTYNFLPFMVLPIYTSLERLDRRYLEAGSDLYASPATTFRKVTLPLSMAGVVSGTLLTFIPAAGDYINASQIYLGSPQTAMVGNVIDRTFLESQQYPIAAALSVLLMGIVLVIVAIYVRRSGTEELL